MLRKQFYIHIVYMYVYFLSVNEIQIKLLSSADAAALTTLHPVSAYATATTARITSYMDCVCYARAAAIHFPIFNFT